MSSTKQACDITTQKNKERALANCVAILGTGSDVGKSIVVAAICRILKNMGYSVAPFKAQNMSNNSYITKQGFEMGRAQVVQAQAAGIEPEVEMNPVLLKPCTDTGAQVVLHGKPYTNSKASEYFKYTDYLFDEAKNSLDKLRKTYELIVMEGAGSCGEVNLRKRDIVNFSMAHASDAPVILVADIDRGGVFAQIIGTLDVIPKKDRQKVKGFIINRFRGDPSLFDDGIRYIEERTGLPVLGLIPFFRDIEIDSEDGMLLELIIDPPKQLMKTRINIAVLRLPHISNFTDFNALERESNVNLHYLSKLRSLDGYDMLLLPGTKNVRGDIDWLKDSGWMDEVLKYEKKGGRIGGICGGYQILGNAVHDPNGVEGKAGTTAGLRLLDIESTLHTKKILCRSSGIWNASGKKIDGYEIHMGITKKSEGLASATSLNTPSGTKEEEGAISKDGRIWGTYLHGLFDMPEFRQTFLQSLRPEISFPTEQKESIHDFRNRQYNMLAKHFEKHLDMKKLLSLLS